MESVNAVQTQDYGDFVTIANDVRVRKDLIVCYMVRGPVTSGEFEGLYSVNYMIEHGWNSAAPMTKEECEKEVLRLDWIYKGEKK